MSQTVHPEVLWAQRSSSTDAEKNVIYLTIKAIDPEDVKIDLKSDSLTYSAKSTHKLYSLSIDFYKEIDVENSKYTSTGSNIFFILRKKELEEEYWPRLIKEKLKLHYIKTDFDKWVDEDEQDEDEKAEELNGLEGLGGMDGGMGGMPGMPGMGGAGGMPDMSQLMASMGGAGGAGGAGGMPDMSQLMASMGGAGGAGGAGGMPDMSQLMASMGGAGGDSSLDALSKATANEEESSADDEEEVTEIKE